MYREFVLRNPDIWQAFCAVVKANAKSFADNGSPFRIILTTDEEKRTIPQNRYFHGPLLDKITEQAWWNGKQYPKEFWKEYFRRRYLLKDEYQMPSGEIINVYWSTADLSASRFAEFIEQVKFEATTEWGVQFDE